MARACGETILSLSMEETSDSAITAVHLLHSSLVIVATHNDGLFSINEHTITPLVDYPSEVSTMCTGRLLPAHPALQLICIATDGMLSVTSNDRVVYRQRLLANIATSTVTDDGVLVCALSDRVLRTYRWWRGQLNAQCKVETAQHITGVALHAQTILLGQVAPISVQLCWPSGVASKSASNRRPRVALLTTDADANDRRRTIWLSSRTSDYTSCMRVQYNDRLCVVDDDTGVAHAIDLPTAVTHVCCVRTTNGEACFTMLTVENEALLYTCAHILAQVGEGVTVVQPLATVYLPIDQSVIYEAHCIYEEGCLTLAVSTAEHQIHIFRLPIPKQI